LVWPEAKIAKRLRPRHGPNDSQHRGIDRREPGDRLAIARGYVRRLRESRGPKGTTSLPADGAGGRQAGGAIGGLHPWRAGLRAARQARQCPRVPENQDCAAAIPTRNRAPSVEATPDRPRADESDDNPACDTPRCPLVGNHGVRESIVNAGRAESG
jgi:hypothetical protein